MNREAIKRSLADSFSGGMTCKAFVETVADYLEEPLSVPQWLRFHMHLGICAGCRQYLYQMRQTLRALAHLPRHTPPIEVRQELLERFREWKDTNPVS